MERLKTLVLASCSIVLVANLLAGCGASSSIEEAVNPVGPTGPATTPVGNLKGTVYGGGVPITGAKIFVMAAGTTGYGFTPNGTVTGTKGQLAVSLLDYGSGGPPSGTPVVGAGVAQDLTTTDIAYGHYYVLTDSGGGFSLTGDYKCVPGTQVYLFSLGGNPGYGGTNSAAGLMAILGNCPASGTLAGQVGYVYMNEVSTVAAAYVMAPYAYDPLHVSSTATTLGAQGIKNAFATAQNLYDIGGSTPGHSALATTSVSNASGTVPQAELDTLANMLQYCINTHDASATMPSGISANCSSLFGTGTTGAGNLGQTTAPTTPTATVATADTATAAIFIAHNPVRNVGTLFGYAVTTATAYAPKLAATPNDWSVSLVFTGGGNKASGITAPHSLGIDGSGNVWQAGYTGNVLNKFNYLGVPANAGGYTANPALSAPLSIGIDTSGNVWTANSGGNYASEFSSAGAYQKYIAYDGTYAATDLQFDAIGNAWITSLGFGKGHPASIVEAFGPSFTYAYATSGDAVQPYSVALQSGTSGSAGVADLDYPEIVYATQMLGSTSDTFLQNVSSGTAADGSNNIWVTEGNYVAKTTSSSATEYDLTGSQHYAPLLSGVAIDGAGYVWVADIGNDATIDELSSTGTILSGTYGLQPVGNSPYVSTEKKGSHSILPNAIAIDGSGNVWYNTATDATIREIVGAAAPVVTPTAYAVAHAQLGARP